MTNNDKIFSNFFTQKVAGEKPQENQEITLETKIVSGKKIDKLSDNDIITIKEEIESYVRDATTSMPEIFKNPSEFKNKTTIRNYIARGLKKYKDEHNVFISRENEEILVQAVWDELIGYGPLEKLLKDETITEIMILNANKIYVEQRGEKILRNDVRFKDYDHIKRILDRIIAPIGRKVDEQTPIVDARLPQGFRLNAVISPISLNGDLYVTIRKFPSKVWTPDDLIKFGSAPRSVFEFLELCVKSKKNVCVSGGTGSGKTTLLNVLSNCIPKDERIITIEDVAELKLVGDHILSEEARHANAEGTGEISIRDLVKTALRQRPDRIVVGECRGAEALDMLQAMNTGHDGSMTTGHANSPVDFLSRLEYMCMCAGDMPLQAIKPQIASAINIVVQIGRVRIDGKPARRMLSICEILNDFDENGNYQLKEIFNSKYKGSDKHEIAPTGYLPTFIDELIEDYDFDPHLLDKPKQYIEPKLKQNYK